MELGRDDHELHYRQSDCIEYIGARLAQEPTTCVPDEVHVCATFVPIAKWGAYPAAVKRKEVDLFLGTVTRATARERSGLRFTHGYVTFHTQLYGHSTDVEPSQTRIIEWLSRDRDIGVIRGSTNEYVLDRLIDEYAPQKTHHLSVFHKKPFDSFPAMEAAMDRGELDGVIIDDVFVERSDWAPVPGLTRTYAWRRYKADFLHTSEDGEEEYAIAVAIDKSDSALFVALEDALTPGTPIRTRYLPMLERSK
jgi:ABC-type amino acid transport substrate-binding protein